MRSEVCASSVTVSTAMPPISSSAVAAQHRAGAAEERRVPEVVAVLHNAVEQLALVGNHAELLQVALERIGRIEMVRRLQHGQLAVAQEPAHRHLQKAARGHVVGVEDGHEGRVHASCSAALMLPALACSLSLRVL